MRIAIVGPGGVGGLLGALLSRAGHEVVVVARGRTLDALRARGLRLDSPLGQITAPVVAAERPGDLGPVDVVLVTVKTWQVPEVAPGLAPLLGPGAVVVPLQNGIQAPDQLADALGDDRVVGGIAHCLSWVVEPGAIRHIGAAPRVTLGRWRRVDPAAPERVRDLLAPAGVDAHVVDDFPQAAWRKWMFITSLGAVCAAARAPIGVVRSVPETRRALVAGLEEVARLARARGVALPDDAVEEAMAFVDRLPPESTPSLYRDIVDGKPSELEDMSGAVARLGAESGVPVPTHATLFAVLLPAEQAARAR